MRATAARSRCFTVESLERLRGELPRLAERLVREWAELHRDELVRNWEQARAGRPLTPFAPLEMGEIHDMVDVEVKSEYGLRVTFDDGAVREVSLEGHSMGRCSSR